MEVWWWSGLVGHGTPGVLSVGFFFLNIVDRNGLVDMVGYYLCVISGGFGTGIWVDALFLVMIVGFALDEGIGLAIVGLHRIIILDLRIQQRIVL
jgi:hypothetical protein